MSRQGSIAEVLAGTADWSLSVGDCLSHEGLPSLPAGLEAHMIGDPPYSEHVHRSVRTNKENPNDALDLGFVHLAPVVRKGICLEAARLGVRWILLFTDAESIGDWQRDLVEKGARYIRAGIWVREQSMPQISGDRPASGAEALAIGYGRDGAMTWNGGGRPAVWRGPKATGKRVHPTQKPLWLMEALIGDFTRPGDLVIDPFAGSGTTGVACIRLGRRFIGWERDEKHHATGTRRIREAREQVMLPVATTSQGMQVLLFGGAR